VRREKPATYNVLRNYLTNISLFVAIIPLLSGSFINFNSTIPISSTEQVSVSDDEIHMEEIETTTGVEIGQYMVMETLTAIVTAYSSSPDETWGDPFITANGERVRGGIIACPRRYNFGTLFDINNEIYECTDRLHPRYDDRFDIWKPSKEEAIQFGKKELTIKVLKKNEWK